MEQATMSQAGYAAGPPGAGSATVSGAEILAVGSLCGLFLLANLATAALFPLVWVDEVMFVDPAINLYLGNGFTSTAWISQPRTEFWASYSPLYQILLYFWIQCFGWSVTAVRALNYVLMILSALLLWHSLLRLDLLKTGIARVMLVLLLLTGFGITFVFRCGRCDCVTLLLSSAVLWVWAVFSPERRRLGLFLLGSLFPAAGLQLIAYAVVMSALLWLYLGKGFLKDALSLFGGALTGFACLMLFFFFKGVAWVFIAQTIASGHTLAGDLAQTAVMGDDKVLTRLRGRRETTIHFYLLYLLDKSFFILLCGLAAGAACLAWQRRLTFRSVVSFCLVSALTVPLAIALAGKYPLYYTWMGFLPVAVGACAALDQLLQSRDLRLAGGALLACCLAAGVVGLPAEMARALGGEYDDYGKVQALVERYVTSQDWVYGDHSIYYAAKPRAAQVLLTTYGGGRNFPEMPSEERESISLLIVGPEAVDTLIQKIGGEWVRVDGSLADEATTVGAHGLRMKYRLEVYRRKNCLAE